jgi:hypothetical protein
MFSAILSGIAADEKSISDIKGNCSAEACTWADYTTLAICASVEEVTGVVRNDTNNMARFNILGSEWNPPTQNMPYVPDSFWKASPYQSWPGIANGQLPPVADLYVAYYPACDRHNKQRTEADWKFQINDASEWKAYKGTLDLCLQTLNSTYNSTMETKLIEGQKELQ